MNNLYIYSSNINIGNALIRYPTMKDILFSEKYPRFVLKIWDCVMNQVPK